MDKIIKGFVVLEGLDGAGTTTQKNIITSLLENKGHTVVSTFEPTDSEVGKLIRKVLRNEVKLPPLSLAMLYAADRENHINGEDGIIENIKNGKIVISDRYFYSSLAYQSLYTDEEKIYALNDFPHPEYLIFLDVDVDTCLKRINKRGQEKEIFEKESLMRKIRENYLKSFSCIPSSVKFLKIEGDISIEETTERILSFLSF